ncbi:MAG: hydroxyacid dehydrogenase, partial [Hyphomicrobiales bacterium]
CIIVQPIHDAGLAVLREAGLSVHVAASAQLEVLRPHLARARAVITRNAGFTSAAMQAAPMLEVIGSHGAGVDSIDLPAARERGLAVVNTPGANAQSVCELTFALIFACAKSIIAADRAVRSGDFDFRYAQKSFELQGRTLGIVGFGHIGQRVARMAQAMGMNVVVCSGADASLLAAHGIDGADLDELCSRVDIVSLHTRPERGVRIDRERLSGMKRGAVLINTARGALVDQAALAAALHSGHLAAAGLDVFAPEPPAADDPLFGAPNLVLAPHIGGSTGEALERTARHVCEDIVRVLRGEKPRNPVVERRP